MGKHGKYGKDRGSTNKMVCRVCSRNHPLRYCWNFLKKNYNERMELVSTHKYCAGCLSHEHTWRTCESEGRCKLCGDMHHTLLHKGSSGRKDAKCLRYGPSSSNRSHKGPSSSVSLNKKGPSSSDPLNKKGPSSSISLNVKESTSTNQSNKKKNNSSNRSYRLHKKGPRSSDRLNEKGHSASNNSPLGRHLPNYEDERERPSTSRALVLYTKKYRREKHRHGKVTQMVTKEESASLPVVEIKESILLKPTAIVRIESHGRFVNERVLIDPSSTCSIISEELVRCISGRRVRVGNKERCFLRLGGQFGSSAIIEVYAEVRQRYKITVPSKTVTAELLDMFPGMQLADPQFFVAAPVMLMLGGDVYSQIIRDGVHGGRLGKPLAQFSIFGYLISGPCSF